MCWSFPVVLAVAAVVDPDFDHDCPACLLQPLGLTVAWQPVPLALKVAFPRVPLVSTVAFPRQTLLWIVA